MTICYVPQKLTIPTRMGNLFELFNSCHFLYCSFIFHQINIMVFYGTTVAICGLTLNSSFVITVTTGTNHFVLDSGTLKNINPSWSHCSYHYIINKNDTVA